MGADTEAQRRAEIARHLAVVDCIAMRDPERASAAVLRTLGEFSEDVRRAVNGPPGAAPMAPRLSLA
jgi:DNA-binding FadR family transcriptional regulator